MPESDSALVTAVLAGDREAFSGLVERYERAVRATALAVVRDHHLAQEVAQESFLGAYTRLGSLRDSSAFGPWLLRIARHRAVNAVRRERRAMRLKQVELAQPDRCDRQLDEDSQRLLAAVTRLPQREQLLVMLHYFDGRKVSDIAEAIGRPVGTVTGTLSRSRDRLRRWLKKDRS